MREGNAAPLLSTEAYTSNTGNANSKYLRVKQRGGSVSTLITTTIHCTCERAMSEDRKPKERMGEPSPSTSLYGLRQTSWSAAESCGCGCERLGARRPTYRAQRYLQAECIAQVRGQSHTPWKGNLHIRQGVAVAMERTFRNPSHGYFISVVPEAHGVLPGVRKSGRLS